MFLTSDGVSDNFDPVVGKFVVARKPDKIIPLATNGAKSTVNKNPHRSTFKNQQVSKWMLYVTANFFSSFVIAGLPTVEAFQRHELTLLRMEDILRNGTTSATAPSSPNRRQQEADNGNHLKAQQLCEDLIDFATRLTTAKRRLLEDLELYVDTDGRPLDAEEQKIRRRKICERLALIPVQTEFPLSIFRHQKTNSKKFPIFGFRENWITLRWWRMRPGSNRLPSGNRQYKQNSSRMFPSKEKVK